MQILMRVICWVSKRRLILKLGCKFMNRIMLINVTFFVRCREYLFLSPNLI